VLPTAREQLLSGRSSRKRKSVKGFRDVDRDVPDLGATTVKSTQPARQTRQPHEPEAPQYPPAKEYLGTHDWNSGGDLLIRCEHFGIQSSNRRHNLMLPKNIESLALTARERGDCLAMLLQHRADRVDCENLPDSGLTAAGALPKIDYPQLSSTATRPLGKERSPIFHGKFQEKETREDSNCWSFPPRWRVPSSASSLRPILPAETLVSGARCVARSYFAP
jgi:hypothetical protein